MFGRLKSLGAELAPRIQAWTSDRAADQNEGERLLDEGSYADAELLLARAVFDSEKKRQMPRNRIQLRLQLAEAQRRQFNPEQSAGTRAKLDAAAESARAALELAARASDKDLLMDCLDMLVAVSAARGDCSEAERYAGEAARVETALSAPDIKRRTIRLTHLGAVRRRVGRVSGAVDAYTEALTLGRDAYGPRHAQTANILAELGDAHRFLGVYHKAEECLCSALRIHEEQLGLDAPETLHDLNLYTAACEASGNIEGAATQHERRLGLKLRVVGADLTQIAREQMTLSENYSRWGNTSRARELVMEAIGTFRRERGPALAAAYEALAAIEESRGHYSDAVHEFEHAAKIWEMLPAKDHTNLARNLQCRAQLLDRMRLPRDAAYLREKIAALSMSGRLAAAS
ncbi:MAG: tetratricopeptide repeat protein [Bryobacteraceae bacterium]